MLLGNTMADIHKIYIFIFYKELKHFFQTQRYQWAKHATGINNFTSKTQIVTKVVSYRIVHRKFFRVRIVFKTVCNTRVLDKRLYCRFLHNNVWINLKCLIKCCPKCVNISVCWTHICRLQWSIELKPWLTEILVWMYSHIHHLVCDEITYPFTDFNGTTIEVWERISDYLSLLGWKSIHVSKMDPWNLCVSWSMVRFSDQ